MNTYIKSILTTTLEWFGIPAFIYFLIWNPFSWNFEKINPTALDISFGAIAIIASIVILVGGYTIILGGKNKPQRIWINHYEDQAEDTGTDNRPRAVKKMTFRDELFSMFSELGDALDNIFGAEADPVTHASMLSGREIFLSLDRGSIVYNGRRFDIDKNAWFDEGGRENIKNIVGIIRNIEQYIEDSAGDADGREFYFSLLRSYLGTSEMKIIREVIENTGTTLKVFE